MSEKAQSLAERFEAVSKDLEQAIETCPDGKWSAAQTPEGWTIAATAHHVAGANGMLTMGVQAIAAGQTPPPISLEQIDAGNAQHAEQFKNCTKQETLELLRKDVPTAADAIRGLSDDQLANKATVVADYGEMSLEQLVEGVLIGHAAGHLASIRTALR